MPNEAYRLGLVNKVVLAEKLDKAKGIEMDLDRALYYEAECFGSERGGSNSKENS